MKQGIYKHNKTGCMYLVMNTATDCTNSRNGTKCVIYIKYKVDTVTELYVRELEEFKQKFTFDRI